MINPVYSAAVSRYDGTVKYRRCGDSGILLPEISLGLWHNFGDVDTLANSREMAHYAFDHGVTHFDLADNYGPSFGSAEETFGSIMKHSFAPYRDELFISTKAGHDMWPGPYGTWNSRKHLIAGLDKSLKRMNLDYVDLFYSHRYDPSTPLQETMQALVDIVRSGKALYVGISKYPPEVAAQAYRYLADHDVPCLIYQGRLNLLDQAPIADGILDQAQNNGVGFIAFSALAQGLLTDKYLQGNIPEHSRMAREAFLKSSVLTPELLDKLNRLAEVAARRGQSLSDMALSWVLSHRQVTSVIVGASSVKQLSENIAAAGNTAFAPEDIAAISEILA